MIKRHTLRRKLFLSLISIFSLLFGSAILSSCYYDNEEFLYPPGQQQSNCDTISPTYDASIAIIIANNSCNSCHSASSHPGTDVITDNYDGLRTNIDRVLSAIDYTGPIPMPRDAPKLTDCEIATIAKWKDLGMPQN